MLDRIIHSEWMRRPFLGNTAYDYLISLFLFIGSISVLLILHKVILAKVEKWTHKNMARLDECLIQPVERAVIPLLYVSAFYFALSNLNLSVALDQLLNAVAVSFLVIQATRFLISISVYFMDGYFVTTTQLANGELKKTPKAIVTIIRVLGWGVAIVFLLDNIGFNISAIVAGLGIGGVAVALAAQTILGDLFNYFVIFFDKPFQEGDFVIIDTHMGEIEHIGIKTTRLRSIGGEQLIIANSDLTSSRLKNYKRMDRRRVVFKVGVVYQTAGEKLKKAPGIIREIIKSMEGILFDRCHFMNFGDSSLDIETVYYVLNRDYNIYMEKHQEILLRIKESFEKENIEFAYPTQTLYVGKT